jgi:hypothetical protein
MPHPTRDIGNDVLASAYRFPIASESANFEPRKLRSRRDQGTFAREENRRWELTTNHWDLPIHVVKADAAD